MAGDKKDKQLARSRRACKACFRPLERRSVERIVELSTVRRSSGPPRVWTSARGPYERIQVDSDQLAGRGCGPASSGLSAGLRAEWLWTTPWSWLWAWTPRPSSANREPTDGGGSQSLSDLRLFCPRRPRPDPTSAASRTTAKGERERFVFASRPRRSSSYVTAFVGLDAAAPSAMPPQAHLGLGPELAAEGWNHRYAP